VNRNALQLALREMQAATTSRFSRVGMILATLVLAVSGPFGTFQSFNLGQRFGYWAIMVLACYLTGQGAATYFMELLREQITQRWPRVIVAGLLASLPVTIVVLVVNGVAYQHTDVEESLMIWLYATIITLAIVVLFVTLGELMRTSPAAAGEAVSLRLADARAATQAPAPTAAPPPAILERVSLPQRGNLIALIVEDHYVDIVTDKGKTLVLMRLADAIREAAPVAGLQVHRSHWVALDAVVRTQRSEGKVMIELSNGMRLPVSRGYLPAAKEAGLVV
jgi:DNA-binding LytR/AlgR family response regulator